MGKPVTIKFLARNKMSTRVAILILGIRIRLQDLITLMNKSIGNIMKVMVVTFINNNISTIKKIMKKTSLVTCL